jgi:hypothetical protein
MASIVEYFGTFQNMVEYSTAPGTGKDNNPLWFLSLPVFKVLFGTMKEKCDQSIRD